MTAAMDFGVLGPLRLCIDGVEIATGTPKQRAVLALLALNRDRPVSVDALVAALWADSPPTGARASLHSYVSNLRKLLGTAGVDPQAVLASAPPGYRLRVTEDDCDLGRFVHAKTAGTRAAAAGQFALAARHFDAALAQWRGPALEDLRDFAFVDPVAAALTEDRLLAVTAHAEAEIACGRAEHVLAGLETCAGEHLYREPLWAQLITAYYLTGRQHDALEGYRRLQSALAGDLGIDPSPALQELHRRILRQEPLTGALSAQTAAVGAVTQLDHRTSVSAGSASAYLTDAAGAVHPLGAVATRIGRLADNDIVLDTANVSRHHAAVIDTGTSYVLSDLGSANGVVVQGARVRGTAALADGDEIRICDHVFTFRLAVDKAAEH